MDSSGNGSGARKGSVDRKPRILGQIATLTLLVLMMGIPLKAQIDTGRILGRVTDTSGAVVPQAKVTLTNEGTGLTLTTTTASDGNYMFPTLKIGTFRVEIEAPGFERFLQAGIPLDVRQDVVVNATLTPGKMTQTVEVKGAPPLLQTQNADVGQTVGGTAVNDLPLNGRDYTTLAEIATGVTYGEPDNSLGRILFSADGHDMWTNDYRLNGIDNNDGSTNPRASIALPPPDALSEFKVETANYSADLGFGGGAVVDATVKSGTNQVHGDAWEYMRNSYLDSANFFANSTGTKKGLFQQSQFGATLGGPVFIPNVYDGRNKTFFFADFQGLRSNQATLYLDTVPTSTMISSGYTNLQDLITYQSGTLTDDLGRVMPLGTVTDPATTRSVTKGNVDTLTGLTATASGYVRDPFYNGSVAGITTFNTAAAKANLNLLPAGRLDSNAIKLLQLYPTPNQSGFINDFTYDPSQTNDTNQADYRIDQNFSPQDQLFFYGNWSHWDIEGPPAIPNSIGGGGDYYGQGQNLYGTQAYALSETHTFSPTTINELRLGFARMTGYKVPPVANQMGIPAQFGIQGILQAPLTGGLPQLAIGGLTTLGVVGPIQQFVNTDWDLTENLTKVYGAHTLKAGFQGDFLRYYLYAPNPGPRGSFTFSGAYTTVPTLNAGSTGMAQLLLSPIASLVSGGFNNVGGANSVSASNIYVTDAAHYYFGIYFQDDWKLTPKLTLNLGVRWDHDTPEQDRNGSEADFIPGPSNNGAEYVIGQHLCNESWFALSPSFVSLMQKDGIAVTCAPLSAFGSGQKANFAPRVGLAYKFLPRMVARAGYGIFYVDGQGGAAGQENQGPSRNYPGSFTYSFPSPNPATPITYSNGSIATLENGLSAVSFNAATANVSGLSLIGRQWKYAAPYYEDYNFLIQYQLTANQTFTLGYVGDQAHHLTQSPGSNQVSEMLPPTATAQTYVPYPDFARGALYQGTSGNTYYHSLQATFERKFGHGTSLNANYTFSKCRSDYRNPLSDETMPGFRAPYLSGFGIKADYSPCDADVPNLLHFSGQYILPFGRGEHFLGNSAGVVNQMVGGWHVNWILTEEDGQPFNVGCPSSTTAAFGCAALLVPGQDIYGAPHNIAHWVNAAAFAAPLPATTIGQTDFSPLGGAVGQAHGPGEHRLDFSAFKQFPITESKHLEFRAEFFNLTNTPWFANPSQLSLTNTALFGQITSLRDGANDPRQIQFALKLYW